MEIEGLKLIVSHKYQFIFIKTAKTAGTSIEVFLEGLCEPDDVVTPIYPPIQGHVPRNYRGFFNPVYELRNSGMRGRMRTLLDVVRRRRFYNHIPASKVRARLPENIWKNYYKFAVERNPWDKTVSHYHMMKRRHRGPLSFDEYVRMGAFCLNYPRYTEGGARKPTVIVDTVVRYEALIDELGAVFQRLGVPFSGDLGVRAKSDYGRNRDHYCKYFTKETRQVIERVFRTEIEIFGYTFDEEDSESE